MTERKAKPPTRADVAAAAGVAPSTVSLILGGKGDELHIPRSTQDRVRRAAEQLGYVPNKLIRAVLRGRTGLFGVHLRWEQWSCPFGYWAQLVWHLKNAVAEAGFQVVIHQAKRGASPAEAFASHAGGLVDGVFIFNSAEDEVVPRLMEARLPAVEIGDAYSQLPFVGSDGAHGIALALKHLKDNGYERPAYLAHQSVHTEDQGSRTREYSDLCQDFGFAGSSEQVHFVSGGHSAYEVYQGMAVKPDCVICASDDMAYNLIGDCQVSCTSVPGDLGVIGFDALDTPQRYPTTTSIDTPMEEMTRLAVQKLIAVVEGTPYERETVLLPGLRLGDTT